MLRPQTKQSATVLLITDPAVEASHKKLMHIILLGKVVHLADVTETLE